MVVGELTAWSDAGALASASALGVGSHEVTLPSGPPLRFDVTAPLMEGPAPVPLLLGAAYPVRRGPQGPFWGAARLASVLGGGVVVRDPTLYLDRDAGLRWYAEGGREAMTALAGAVGRLSGLPPMVVTGGHLVVPAMEVAAATGGQALVWNPTSEELSPAGLRAEERPTQIDAEGLDWCDIDLPPRLLVFQNADDPSLAAIVGPFLDENEMLPRDDDAYAVDDDHVIAFPAMGIGVTEVGRDVLAAAVRALSAPRATVWDAHRAVAADGAWASLRAPRDLRDAAADLVAAVSLEVSVGEQLTAVLRWGGAMPEGLTRELVAYGRTGRLRDARVSDTDRATWPDAAAVTHVVAHLTDECGHEIGTLRRTAPFPASEPR